MTERWRCFVAAALDDATRAALAAAVSDWRREPPADALRWAEPEGWHLTLAFLGSVDADTVPAITDAVVGVAAAHAPMVIPTGRLGAFPRPGSARVLWYGIGDPDGALAALASDLGDALGLEPGGPFRAHVTLARARGGPHRPEGLDRGRECRGARGPGTGRCDPPHAQPPRPRARSI